MEVIINTQNWIDESRDREVTTVVYSPDSQEAFPLMLFSPGLYGLPEDYEYLLTDIAKQGYIVAGIIHKYSSRTTWYRWKLSYSTREAIDRIGDVSYVIDQMQQYNLVPNQVIGMGHSFGARTMLWAGGVDFRGDYYTEERLNAIISLGTNPDNLESRHECALPLLLMVAGGSDNTCDYQKAEDFYWTIKNCDKYIIRVNVGGHLDYVNRGNSTVHKYTKLYTEAYSNWYFKGDQESHLKLTPEYAQQFEKDIKFTRSLLNC